MRTPGCDPAAGPHFDGLPSPHHLSARSRLATTATIGRRSKRAAGCSCRQPILPIVHAQSSRVVDHVERRSRYRVRQGGFAGCSDDRSHRSASGIGASGRCDRQIRRPFINDRRRRRGDVDDGAGACPTDCGERWVPAGDRSGHRDWRPLSDRRRSDRAAWARRGSHRGRDDSHRPTARGSTDACRSAGSRRNRREDADDAGRHRDDVERNGRASGSDDVAVDLERPAFASRA